MGRKKAGQVFGFEEALRDPEKEEICTMVLANQPP